MHRISFFPLGNADSCRIDTSNGKKFLFDFGNERDPENTEDKRIDLFAELKKDLEASKRDSYDVVAFTHLDNDHVCGAPDFFFLEHAEKYQSEDRTKIGQMWVPAAVIIETRPDGDAGIVQAEARYRLKNKRGIRVFSRPDALHDWMTEQGLNVADYTDFIIDAGQVVPEFTLENDGIEFFVHSPFAEHCDDNTYIERNDASLVFQVRLREGEKQTDFILGSDTTHEIWASIVKVTRYHNREDRLRWNIFKLPHHCSYLSLGPEKGKEKTEPIDEVKWLYEEQGQEGSYIISTSDPIPNEDTDQPPHRQAANYLKSVAAGHDGDFMVTMEHNQDAPEPIVFEIGPNGLEYQRSSSQKTGDTKLAAAISAARGTPAPPAQRVGFGRYD
ncbi:MAG: hypothetical protein ABSF28_23805 [Terracidiphilus sp.]|jgi:hypothetical protein